MKYPRRKHRYTAVKDMSVREAMSKDKACVVCQKPIPKGEENAVMHGIGDGVMIQFLCLRCFVKYAPGMKHNNLN